jgi:HK97 family phage portal protein
MGLFTRPRAAAPSEERFFGISGVADLFAGSRSSRGVGSVTVTHDTALRHSAVWAALRMRAGLISSMPLDVFRDVNGEQVETTKPPVLVSPDGEIDVTEWMYSTQMDIDRAGNAFGLITAKNAAGLPAVIELQSLSSASIVQRPGQPRKYKFSGKEYPADQVWHEKANTIPGLPMGLSPVTYAAWSIGQYQSAQHFALDWYASGGIPKSHLKNTKMPQLPKAVADEAKARFKASVEGRDIFVTGSDWEYSPIQAQNVGMDWLEAQKFGINDVARFFDVPGDLIDAGIVARNITYANVTQRNLQFLIFHMNAAVVRRERALSRLLPAPRYVKINTDALLRMDPLTAAEVLGIKVANRVVTPNEWRKLDNRPALTQEQIDEFDKLFPHGSPQPATPSSSGSGNTPGGSDGSGN